MILHFAGKYSGKETDLPQREHPAGATKFKEAEDLHKFAVVMNIVAILLIIILLVIACCRAGGFFVLANRGINFILGGVIAVLCAFPHEFLHAICFKKDVYVYENLAEGMLFVIGTEDMSKARFIFMSFLPNLVFGVTVYCIFLVFPNLGVLAVIGAVSLGMGVGDYYNVFNALTQMPRNAKTYLCGIHSYWYIPESEKKD